VSKSLSTTKTCITAFHLAWRGTLVTPSQLILGPGYDSDMNRAYYGHAGIQHAKALAYKVGA
jgi:hypothetical protein